jgi:hypothetical protein
MPIFMERSISSGKADEEAMKKRANIAKGKVFVKKVDPEIAILERN